MEPPLRCVAAVFDRCESLAGCTPLAALTSSFLDASARWTVERAACAGLMTLLKRLGTREAPLAPRQLDWAMRTAADRGDLAVVRWLTAYRPGVAVSTRVMDSAALRGHLHVVQWLHEFRAEGCSTHAMDAAAACGRLDVVRWLHEHRREGCTTAAMDSAAAAGHLEVLQWLAKHRREGCTTVALHFAVLNGHIRVLWWLREHQRLVRKTRGIREEEGRGEEDGGLDAVADASDDDQEEDEDEENEDSDDEDEPQQVAAREMRWLTSGRWERRASASLVDPGTTWDQLHRMRRYH
jgi:hypothetical protein